MEVLFGHIVESDQLEQRISQEPNKKIFILLADLKALNLFFKMKY